MTHGGTHDLTDLLAPHPESAVRYGQGEIISWDPDTFENRIDWNGVLLEDLPVIAGLESFGFRTGQTVGLLGWDSAGNKGMTTWWILGRLIVPGSSEFGVEIPDLLKAKVINVDELNADVINIDGKDLSTFISEGITEQVPDSDPDPPPGGSVKKSKIYNASWSQAYQGDNSKNTFNDKPRQGFWSSTNGNQRSLIGFPSSTIQSDLSAATSVTKVRVYMYFDHWYFNSGGTAIIGHHGHTNEPSTFSATTDVVRSSNWPKPGGRWVTYSDDRSEWKTGVKKGISIGPGPSTNRLYYGSIRGSDESSKPRLEITWEEPA
jgi:hypothetical protein